MTPKDWIKIVAGMLGIFIIGMIIRTGFHVGERKVEQITHSASTLSIPMLGAPFRLHDLKLGSLKQLQVKRSAPDKVEGFDLTVRLNDSVDVEQFADCELTVTDAHQIDNKMAFACLTEADSGFSDLVQVGTILFQPSGQRHRLMLPSSVVEDLRNGPDGNQTDAVSRHDSSGNVNITINGQQVVDIPAQRCVVHQGHTAPPLQEESAGHRAPPHGTQFGHRHPGPGHRDQLPAQHALDDAAAVVAQFPDGHLTHVSHRITA